ncbi:MAG TPA: hypothetical protein VG860_01665 [Terriglobia bacterium]|jgi:hypothetical protein|nr:hypothetical protein [Terriglobia bacterium]
MSKITPAIPFAGSTLDESRHVCAHNPFFVPPDEFLRDFRQRRSTRSTSSAAV